MNDHFIQLRVVYSDPPDLIELEISVQYDGWSAVSTAYASPGSLRKQTAALLDWVKHPKGRTRLDAGADTGIGWMVLDFYTIDAAGHTRCAVNLATGNTARNARPEETWRLMIEVKTEIGLVERFAKEMIRLCDTLEDARLGCIRD